MAQITIFQYAVVCSICLLFIFYVVQILQPQKVAQIIKLNFWMWRKLHRFIYVYFFGLFLSQITYDP